MEYIDVVASASVSCRLKSPPILSLDCEMEGISRLTSTWGAMSPNAILLSSSSPKIKMLLLLVAFSKCFFFQRFLFVLLFTTFLYLFNENIWKLRLCLTIQLLDLAFFFKNRNKACTNSTLDLSEKNKTIYTSALSCQSRLSRISMLRMFNAQQC